MPFNRKKILFLFCLSCLLSLPVQSQEAQRWLKIPFAGTPAFTRQPLHMGDRPGIIIQSKYSKQPVRPLMRILRKNFPELWPRKVVIDDSIDISESTLLLESMQNEADSFLKIATETYRPNNASAPVSLF